MLFGHRQQIVAYRTFVLSNASRLPTPHVFPRIGVIHERLGKPRAGRFPLADALVVFASEARYVAGRHGQRGDVVFRRMLMMLATLLAAVAVCAAPANAEFRYQNVGGAEISYWNSCLQVAVGDPCALTFLEAETVKTNDDFTNERDCVFIEQGRGVKDGDYTLHGVDHTYANACGAASVVVAASLTHGHVEGILPARNCHFDLATGTETCTASTPLDVSVAWQGTGDVVGSSPVTYHYSYEPGQRCLLHLDPARYRDAVASGQIAGLPAPLGDFQEARLFFGGGINVGTDSGCYD
jgi:hypothetical protein